MFDDWSNGRIIFGLGAMALIGISILYQFTQGENGLSGFESMKNLFNVPGAKP